MPKAETRKGFEIGSTSCYTRLTPRENKDVRALHLFAEFRNMPSNDIRVSVLRRGFSVLLYSAQSKLCASISPS